VNGVNVAAACGLPLATLAALGVLNALLAALAAVSVMKSTVAFAAKAALIGLLLIPVVGILAYWLGARRRIQRDR
jgi:hypothetical protein